MGISMGPKTTTSHGFRPQKLPIDASTLAMQSEGCHCVADAELDNRYNILRAEEHARKEGKCGPEWTCEVACLQENRSRNRYPSVVPWDHSRVLLPVEEGHNDYINASWVQMGSRTYIATQGPLSNTVPDFWQMVYAYGGEPAVIIMLTPLYEHAVEKCCKYWPDSKQHPVELPKEHGFRFGLTVSLKSYHKNDHYHYSSFLLTPSDKSMPQRTVHHVYYHSWLDYSKPNADADLRSLIHLVNNQLRNRACPPIVHCSAGIGRTGTFIALDALISRIDLDILPVVIPRISPIWKGNQHILQFRDSLFTGAEDLHVESDSNSPLLSKFDVKRASSVTPSLTSPSKTTKSSPPANAFKDPQNLSLSSTANVATKRMVPQSVSTNTSLLSAAIASSRNNSDNSESVAGFSEALTPQTICECNEEEEGFEDCQTTGSSHMNGDALEEGDGKVRIQNDMEDELRPKTSPPRKSSALSGPAIRKVAAKITSVGPEVFSETPETVDVMEWYDPRDPVMSAVRTMRKQRAKMVQGKQQLGYIYDQFEVGQQLARVTHTNGGTQITRRRSTLSSMNGYPASPSSTTHQSSRHHYHSKPLRVLTSMVGLRRSSNSSTQSTQSDSATSPSSTPALPKKRGLFSGSILR